MPDQQVTDEEILKLANEIKSERGISLIEAMDIASTKLNNQGQEVNCEFDLKITLKPRVAKFFRETFAGHPDLSVEQRMAVYLAMMLNRLRGEALARTREEAEITEDQANTIRRSTFLERNLG